MGMQEMQEIDLSTLDLDDLRKLRKDVDKAISTFRDRQIQAAREELEALAREKGFTLTEVVSAPGRKLRKIGSAAKYRHPENPKLTWSGFGRRPRWLTEALEAGKSLDDLKV